MRWLIASLTSIAVIALIYHNGIPRTRHWHMVLPGAALATGMWLGSTLAFGWYLRRYADYSIIYGFRRRYRCALWMYLLSLIVLIGAEFNAMFFPRALGPRPVSAKMRVHGPVRLRIAATYPSLYLP
jgi:membrane protein